MQILSDRILKPHTSVRVSNQVTAEGLEQHTRGERDHARGERDQATKKCDIMTIVLQEWSFQTQQHLTQRAVVQGDVLASFNKYSSSAPQSNCCHLTSPCC